MKTVAESPALNQAVADLSRRAASFLELVHAGAETDVSAAAERQLRTIREIARCTGVPLDDLPAWNANITTWRAIARLAYGVGTAARAG
jgi:hypothetical protein